MLKLAVAVERWICRFGLIAGAILLPLLIIVRNVEVFQRNVLSAPGSVYNAMESELFLLFVFLIMASAYVNDAHVRVDILRARFSAKTRAWIELLGGVFFVFPFTLVVIWYGSYLVRSAYQHGEKAAIAFGAPLRWVIVLSMLIGMGLFALAVLARLIRIFHALDNPQNASDDH